MDVIALETPENTEKHSAPRGVFSNRFLITEYGRTRKGIPCYQLRLDSSVFCVQYVYSGSGVIIYDGRIYTVREGDTFLLRAGRDQIYYSNPDNDFERIWLNFKGPLADALLSVYGIEEQVVFRGEGLDEKINSIIERLLVTADEDYENACAGLFLGLVQGLSACREEERPLPSAVEQIRLYLDLHITENLKLSEVAKKLSFSKEHIIRLFKQTYGITPHSYVLQSKIRIAMIKLSSTDETVEHISDSLSFCDPHHFSARFAQIVGERPSVYRARMRNNRK